MFIQVAVVLARAKAAIFLFDKEECGSLRGVQEVDHSTIKVFLEEICGGLVFIREEGVDFSDLGGERFVKVDLMVIGSRQWNVVSSLLGDILT